MLEFSASDAGVYYIGVSSYNNTAYDPKVAGSGVNSLTTAPTG